jgi:hypothetical protein
LLRHATKVYALASNGSSSFADRILSIVAVAAMLMFTAPLIVFNQPFVSELAFLLFRTGLSLSAAVLGASIPGLLNVSWSGRGRSLRAGGALALFAITFVYNPASLMAEAEQHQTLSQSKMTYSIFGFLSSIGFILSLLPLIITGIASWLNYSRTSEISIKGNRIDIKDLSATDIIRIVEELNQQKHVDSRSSHKPERD